MAWTLPKTWVDGELVDAETFNEQIRDNLNYLLAPNAAMRATATGSLSTTSTVFASLGTAFALTLNTNGGHVLVGAQMYGSSVQANDQNTYLAFDVDGVAYPVHSNVAATPIARQVQRLFTGIPSGAHTFTLMWRVMSGTITAFASPHVLPMEFWVVEG